MWATFQVSIRQATMIFNWNYWKTPKLLSLIHSPFLLTSLLCHGIFPSKPKFAKVTLSYKNRHFHISNLIMSIYFNFYCQLSIIKYMGNLMIFSYVLAMVENIFTDSYSNVIISLTEDNCKVCIDPVDIQVMCLCKSHQRPCLSVCHGPASIQRPHRGH